MSALEEQSPLILIVMHEAHLSAGGAKSAVGRANAGRCKTPPGDAGDAGDAYSYCTVYGEKIYSFENMFF